MSLYLDRYNSRNRPDQNSFHSHSVPFPHQQQQQQHHYHYDERFQQHQQQYHPHSPHPVMDATRPYIQPPRSTTTLQSFQPVITGNHYSFIAEQQQLLESFLHDISNCQEFKNLSKPTEELSIPTDPRLTVAKPFTSKIVEPIKTTGTVMAVVRDDDSPLCFSKKCYKEDMEIRLQCSEHYHTSMATPLCDTCRQDQDVVMMKID